MRHTDEYLRVTHAGRKICDAEDLGLGYCGSISFEGHCSQMGDPGSWVHSSKARWLERGGGLTKAKPVAPSDGMHLKVEISEDELKKLLAAALTERLKKPVDHGTISFVVHEQRDMRNEPYGHTVTAQAILPL